MKKMKKRCLNLALALTMVITSVSMPVYAQEGEVLGADSAEESILETEFLETQLEESYEETESSETYVEESYIETEPVESDLIEPETEGFKTIVGFDALSQEVCKLNINKYSKPSFEELLTVFPSSLIVYLEDGSALAVDVTWHCDGDDFDASDADYYQFTPTWDESFYLISGEEDLQIDIPCIEVFITEDGMGMRAVTSSKNETTIYNFLKSEMGLNTAAACGVLANIQKESSFKPTATGDNGTSYGICQWHNSRWDAMKTWCNSKGYDWKTLTGQLNYLKFELSRNNANYLWNGKTIYNYISSVSNTAQGAYDAGYYWCYYYEVPANKASVSVTRGNLAKNTYWPEYSKNEVMTVTFELKGGNIAGAKGSMSLSGINVERNENALVVYNIAGNYSGTNEQGVEIAVDSKGCVIEKRDYGNESQLKVPQNGFVLSGHGEAAEFVNNIQLGNYVVYSKAGTETAYYYESEKAYLYDYRQVKNGAEIGELPVPVRDGYEFLGWFTTLDSGNVYPIDSSYKVKNNVTLYAHWSRTEHLGVQITFDAQGGEVPEAYNQIEVTGFNMPETDSDVIIYNQSESRVNTTKQRIEIAIDSNGKVTGKRNLGSESLLTVPKNGWVLSLNSADTSFYAEIQTGDYIGYKKESDGTVYACHYKNQGDYVYHHKYVNNGDMYGSFPVISKDGYLLEGWYTEQNDGIEMEWNTVRSATHLYAHWVKAEDAEASIIILNDENDHVYKRYDYIMSWKDAEVFCEAQGGYLVTITSKNEQQFVVENLLMTNYRRGHYAIGATDENVEGRWEWVNGEQFSYSAWDLDAPEPTNENGANYASIMAADFGKNKTVSEWIDIANYEFGNNVYATSDMGFICEFDKCDHTYVGYISKEPTCVEYGEEIFTCSKCGHKFTAVLEFVDHDYDDGVVTVKPTSQNTGLKVYTCTVCGDENTEILPIVNIVLPFVDVSKNNWFYDSVVWVYENGLITGTSDITFSPNAPMTRGMLVTVLYRKEGRPIVEEGNKFPDVNLNKYYAPAIIWASANNLVSGYTNGNFGPEDSITREQIAKILYLYAAYEGYDTSNTTDISVYKDAAKVSGYAKKYMEWAVAEGLIKGSNGELNPKGDATRAEIAAILRRFVEKYEVK